MKRNACPIWLDDLEADAVPLERVSGKDWKTLAANNNASEKSLQDMLARCPDALPFAEFDRVFAPAVCIACEASTSSGNIDLLYLSRQGHVIIVETKLHKNPEARREVVAQVLDYAKNVSSWSYSDLEARAKQYFDKTPSSDSFQGLWKLVRQAPGQTFAAEDDDFSSEDDFKAEVERNLRRGRILGLVVTDQIIGRTQDLVEFTNKHMGMAVELGLVEMAFYRKTAGGGPVLVVPRVVEQTAIVERVLVEVKLNGEAPESNVSVRRAEQDPGTLSAGKRPKLASEEDFLDRVQARTDDQIQGCCRAVVRTFNEIVERHGDVYEVGYNASSCGLYWRQDENQTRRVLGIDTKGVFSFVHGYLLHGGGLPELASVVHATGAAHGTSQAKYSHRLSIGPDNYTQVAEAAVHVADELAKRRVAGVQD